MKKLSQRSLWKSTLTHTLAFVLVIIAFSGIAASTISNSVRIVPPPGNGVPKDIPIDATFYNLCCDEEVHVSGTAHLLINNNVMHVVVQDISGVGLTTNYNYAGIGASTETNVKYSSQDVGILTFHLHLSNDDGCSFKLKLTWQIHVNANGEVTAELMKTNVQCDE